MIIDLTGMDIANASLLDEATAAAEAMTMARRLAKSRSNTVLIDQNCHPQTIAVVQTRAGSLGYEVVVADPFSGLEQHDFFALILQYPNSGGEIHDLTEATAVAHAKSALVTVAADLLSLVLLTPPAKFGADIVVGSAQRFGVPMGYGGPHAAFFATRDDFKRSMPGRLIGVSKDTHGQVALRMALQTREQHIRRDKATSNICTSQVLLAVIAGFYAVYHGADGLRLIAGRVHRYARILAAGLARSGYPVLSQCYFDTIRVRVPNRARRFAAQAEAAGINLRVIDPDTLGIALDEATTRDHIRALWQIFASPISELPDVAALDAGLTECIRPTCCATMRSLRIRYSVCTIRKPNDALHAPAGAARHCLGSSDDSARFLHDEAERRHRNAGHLILRICGDASFRAAAPNPGLPAVVRGIGRHALRPDRLRCLFVATQCRFARRIHRPAGDPQIPSGQRPGPAQHLPDSGLGARHQPASATLAGLHVVVVACDDHGNVDVADLRAKAQQYQDTLAALMITYPSTHGVYEAAFREICDIVHQHGGQVYMDGANFNALVGLCRPAESVPTSPI